MKINEEEILKIYRSKFNDEEIFFHLIERIRLHEEKLKKLKKDKDKQEIFQRELADLYLLSKVLLELEKVSDKTIKQSYEYYINKIKELFENKNGKI